MEVPGGSCEIERLFKQCCLVNCARTTGIQAYVWPQNCISTRCNRFDVICIHLYSLSSSATIARMRLGSINIVVPVDRLNKLNLLIEHWSWVSFISFIYLPTKHHVSACVQFDAHRHHAAVQLCTIRFHFMPRICILCNIVFTIYASPIVLGHTPLRFWIKFCASTTGI